jgi:5-methylcytosine-specific restriction endonuclease McrA
MAKCKHDFSKEELERLYEEHGSFSLAGKDLGVSKSTFRQQYLKSQGKCMICSSEIPEDHSSQTCEDCLNKNRVADKPSSKSCSNCSKTIHRLKGQSKISWSKKQDCEECLSAKYKISAKKTYIKFRPRNLEKDRNDPRVKEYQKAYRNSDEGKLKRQICSSNRRASKVTTASPTINSHIESLLNDPNASCPYCPSTDKLSIEHILPLSRGGTHTEDNVELACLECNIRKGNKTKQEFIEFLNSFKEV